MYKLGNIELPDPNDPRWSSNSPNLAENSVYSCGPVCVSYVDGFNIRVGGIDLSKCNFDIKTIDYNNYVKQVINCVQEKERHRRTEEVLKLLADFNSRIKT